MEVWWTESDDLNNIWYGVRVCVCLSLRATCVEWTENWQIFPNYELCIHMHNDLTNDKQYRRQISLNTAHKYCEKPFMLCNISMDIIQTGIIAWYICYVCVCVYVIKSSSPRSSHTCTHTRTESNLSNCEPRFGLNGCAARIIYIQLCVYVIDTRDVHKHTHTLREPHRCETTNTTINCMLCTNWLYLLPRS